jgi:hypothetical protein
MDQAIRNKLRGVVTQCRRLLEDAVREELQGKFGVYAARKDDVQVDPEARMTHLGEEERVARRDLLHHYDHVKARGFRPREALDQLVREVAFTHLNRLCAYKMMEARQVYVGDQRFREAVSRGVDSNGVKFYLADHPDDERLFTAGRQDLAYRHFLDWLGGLLSEEIGVLFSPHDPANRLYPPQRVLDEVLALINDEALAGLWGQDETIGWVYQYFTPKELRDQARKESQAPRNSYELAFRNQFFTPRYVVEFLTDNTLGRTWYEMRKGDTRLGDQCRYMVRRPTEVFLGEGQRPPEGAGEVKDDLPQEEPLELPVYVAHRPKKDPRELKVLDPACGSGHFLLYCFDLLLTIYEEAYADPDLGPALRRDYRTLDALRRDVPRLILAHNLHGIDIDLRATQIAALALWLRCQRAYQEMGLKKDRPRITRSNIVCAEPMPGEEHMLKEFVSELEPKLLGQLVEVVFDKMKLAGEAGSLLKIEEEIRDAVAEAKRQWLAGPVSIQRSLFDEDQPAARQQRFDFSGISDAQFFEQVEVKVVETLRNYAEKAHNGPRLQRRLFADDAVRGFAFVDLCHKRFDVSLMNPPFGWGVPDLRSYEEDQYPNSKNDLYCMFVERALTRSQRGGVVGCLTSRTAFFLPSMRLWREHVLLGGNCIVQIMADLGFGVLDNAFVETAATVISTNKTPFGQMLCFRVNESDNKRLSLRHDVQQTRAFPLTESAIRVLPGAPFTYWISGKIRKLFRTCSGLGQSGVTVAVGLATSDNERFLRLRWEVPVPSKRWVPYPKGGDFAKHYQDIFLMVDWDENGRAIKEQVAERYGSASRFVQNTHLYGKAGLTYPRVSVKGFSVRIMPKGCIFSDVGQGIFSDRVDNWFLLGLLNTDICEFLMRTLTPSRKWDAGFLKSIPFPPIVPEVAAEVVRLTKDVCGLLIQTDREDETTAKFLTPCVYDGSLTLDGHIRHFQVDCASRDAKRAEAVSCINRLALNLYGVSETDFRQATNFQSDNELLDEAEEGEGGTTPSGNEGRSFTTKLLSYSVGVLYGRWDIRVATGQSPIPEYPDPFLTMPVCSPGMLQGVNGLPADCAPARYQVRISWDGIQVDDNDHADDIVRRVREVLEAIWKDRADDIENEVRDLLGAKELRDYFRRPGKGGFWDDHVSRYSRSRRKAPIYWLLQSSRKNYALWLYYHRLDKDLLFKALVNYVEPKIRLEESRLETLRTQKAAAGSSGRDARRLGKEVERQEDLLSELRDFEDKLRRAANLHLEPDLNDGVVLNIAPLHELVPWKEARSYRQELLAGKYEWSSIGKQLREKGLVE